MCVCVYVCVRVCVCVCMCMYVCVFVCVCVRACSSLLLLLLLLLLLGLRASLCVGYMRCAWSLAAPTSSITTCCAVTAGCGAGCM